MGETGYWLDEPPLLFTALSLFTTFPPSSFSYLPYLYSTYFRITSPPVSHPSPNLPWLSPFHWGYKADFSQASLIKNQFGTNAPWVHLQAKRETGEEWWSLRAFSHTYTYLRIKKSIQVHGSTHIHTHTNKKHVISIFAYFHSKESSKVLTSSL